MGHLKKLPRLNTKVVNRLIMVHYLNNFKGPFVESKAGFDPKSQRKLFL